MGRRLLGRESDSAQDNKSLAFADVLAIAAAIRLYAVGHSAGRADLVDRTRAVRLAGGTAAAALVASTLTFGAPITGPIATTCGALAADLLGKLAA